MEELNTKEQPNHDWWDTLSEVQRHNINEGIKDVEEGRTVPSVEFWKILKNA